ncbi:MAG: protein kinase [Candidatus Obscuribacterales bacterium]|nr:protein kinase [Candidatus Obscuribacterales bacterium]
MKLCLVCNFQFEDDRDICPKDLSKLVPLGKDPLIGKLIQDKYRIEVLLAKGSMGVIYKAVQEHIGREVAIKVMHSYLVSDEESLKRYYKEAKAASRLNHPNIITLYDFGVLSSGQPYIVMDLLQGKSLYEILQQRGELNLKQTIMVFQQACLALAEAHKRGVIHRDIKPENIVIDELADGQNIQVKVVDFGIATFPAEPNDTLGKITKTGTVCGSPFYMSPEQCSAGAVDARSDLYSLGIVLFECLTGKIPFDSKDIYQVLNMQMKDQPPSLKQMRPDLTFPDYIEMVLVKALAKDPSARYQNAEEFWSALAGTNVAKPVAAPAPPPAPRAVPPPPAPTPVPVARPIQSPSTAANNPADDEELKRKIRAKTLNMQQPPKVQNSPKRIRSVSLTDRLLGFGQIILPPLMTLTVTILLFWVVANESLVHTGIPHKTKNQIDVETLLAQNKFEQARKILEKKKHDKTFAVDDQENLNLIYINLARKEAKAKRYKQAIALLELGSPEMKEQEEIKLLFKRYKKQLSKQ